ncbi:CHAD domain-containing protein [Marinobacter antarcticus]|uniref:CHAD domain-containing protein n=1 Tax=Marinobacter antarcticus TaxID=564117 RepID=A0A1M6PBM2_9GAMM|nr:CHAD domain-containing protein [Marinobacter antarcticus]SHK05336.1 CHAD domain-containing protein [Marinobacter antarcticus]
MRYRLNPNGNFGKHLKRLMQSINEDISLALLHACRVPETGVHEARKSCKEMRALLRLIRPQIGKAEYSRWQEHYKTISGKLSGSRDAIVRVNTWRGLVKENAALQEQRYDAIDRFLSEQQKLNPLEAKGREFFMELALEVEAQSPAPQEWDLPKSLSKLMPNLKHLYQKARDAEKKANSSGDIEAFHQFRKRSKDLFYCSRALRPMFGKSLKSKVDGLEAMTELQGSANDQAVLLEYLTDHRHEIGLDSEQWDLAEACIVAKLQELQKQTHKLAKKLLSDSPASFIKSL